MLCPTARRRSNFTISSGTWVSKVIDKSGQSSNVTADGSPWLTGIFLYIESARQWFVGVGATADTLFAPTISAHGNGTCIVIGKR